MDGSKQPSCVVYRREQSDQMKTLLILRHAKTERDNHGGDKKRALTDRGKRDALKIAKQIGSIAGCSDSIVTSDAKRAHQTAAIVADEIGYDKSLVIEEDVYGADVDGLLDVIHRFLDADNCVLLVGHNPGLEELGVALTKPGTPNFHLPTSGLLHIEFDVGKWGDVGPGKGQMAGMYGPKALMES